MTVKKRIKPSEIILGVLLAGLSYFFIAVMNISNEDLYNWDLEIIFSEGGVLGITAIILYGLWWVLVPVWLIRLVYRLIKMCF